MVLWKVGPHHGMLLGRQGVRKGLQNERHNEACITKYRLTESVHTSVISSK